MLKRLLKNSIELRTLAGKRFRAVAEVVFKDEKPGRDALRVRVVQKQIYTVYKFGPVAAIAAHNSSCNLPDRISTHIPHS